MRGRSRGREGEREGERGGRRAGGKEGGGEKAGPEGREGGRGEGRGGVRGHARERALAGKRVRTCMRVMIVDSSWDGVSLGFIRKDGIAFVSDRHARVYICVYIYTRIYIYK